MDMLQHFFSCCTLHANTLNGGVRFSVEDFRLVFDKYESFFFFGFVFVFRICGQRFAFILVLLFIVTEEIQTGNLGEREREREGYDMPQNLLGTWQLYGMCLKY